MNCCDDYGDCRQGRDCPVRKARIQEVKRLLDEDDDSLAPPTWMTIITVVLVVSWIGFAIACAMEAMA